MPSRTKIVVILGQTAVGKTDLSINLARKFSGEVVSADSRQVYTGLDIGTAKITPDETGGIPHHLINVISPAETFTAGDFREQGEVAITEIVTRGNVPFVVGGTGFYIQSLIDDIALPAVPPDPKLRAELSLLSNTELFQRLQKIDPARADTIDPRNTVRLIRALEIATALGSVPASNTGQYRPEYDVLQIGLTREPADLKVRIHNRNVSRIESGALQTEVSTLLENKKITHERLEALGLEYRYTSRFLQGEIKSTEELITLLDQKIWQFAKRQKTWWQKDERIQWFSPDQEIAIMDVVEKFLAN